MSVDKKVIFKDPLDCIPPGMIKRDLEMRAELASANYFDAITKPDLPKSQQRLAIAQVGLVAMAQFYFEGNKTQLTYRVDPFWVPHARKFLSDFADDEPEQRKEIIEKSIYFSERSQTKEWLARVVYASIHDPHNIDDQHLAAGVVTELVSLEPYLVEETK